MSDYRACPKCGDPGYVTVAGEHLCGNAGCDHTEPLEPGWESEEHRLRRQLAAAIDALRRLAEIHHGTIVPSKLHDSENRDWTECECESCRLAQPFGGSSQEALRLTRKRSRLVKHDYQP